MNEETALVGSRNRRPLPKQLIYRERDLNQMTTLSRKAREDAMAAGTFPKPIQLSVKARGWLASEVDQWLKDLIAERDAAELSGGTEKDGALN